jgi:hypothetical protein
MRASRPKDALVMRIENRAGGGIPDVHVLWKSLPFWLELKVLKNFGVIISPHQVAWHTAYWARGGLSFFLVKAPASGYIHLFSGSEAVDLATKPMSEVQGSMFKGVDAVWEALRAASLDHYSAALRPAALRPAP